MAPGPVDVEDAAVSEGNVDLNVVGVPLVGHGLDADRGQAERPTVIPDPRVHRLAQLEIVGLFGEDELELLAQPAAQVSCHVALPKVSAGPGTP